MLWSLVKHIKNRTSIFQYTHGPLARQGSLHRVPKMFLAWSSSHMKPIPAAGQYLNMEALFLSCLLSLALDVSASLIWSCAQCLNLHASCRFVCVPGLCPCFALFAACVRGLVCKAWFAVWRRSRLLRYRSVYIWGCDSPRLCVKIAL